MILASVDKKVTRAILKGEENVLYLKPLSSFSTYLSAYKEIKKVSEKSDIILSFGGRVSTLLPLLYFKGYRNLYIYELNAVMGRSNKLARPFCKKCFSYFPLESQKEFNIGSPLEGAIYKQKTIGELKNILVLSGSLGSDQLKDDFLKVSKILREYHFTISNGTRDKTAKDSATVGLIDRKKYKNYDLVFARSGAGTIADLIKSGVPFVLLPSKNVKDDHQKKNALYLHKNYGLKYLDYDEQNPSKIVETINLLKEKGKREELVKGIREFHHDDVLKRLERELSGW